MHTENWETCKRLSRLTGAREELADVEAALLLHRKNGERMKVTFGRHSSKSLAEVFDTDWSYIRQMPAFRAYTNNFRIMQEWSTKAVELMHKKSQIVKRISELQRAQRIDEYQQVKKLRMSTARGQLCLLPDDILLHLCNHLSLFSLGTIRKVSARFNFTIKTTGWIARVGKAYASCTYSAWMARRAVKIPSDVSVSDRGEFERIAHLVEENAYSDFNNLRDEGRKAIQDFIKKRNQYRKASKDEEYSGEDAVKILPLCEKMKTALVRCRAAVDEMRKEDETKLLRIAIPNRGIEDDGSVQEWMKFCSAQ